MQLVDKVWYIFKDEIKPEYTPSTIRFVWDNTKLVNHGSIMWTSRHEEDVPLFMAYSIQIMYPEVIMCDVTVPIGLTNCYNHFIHLLKEFKQNPNLDITKYEKRYKEMLIVDKLDRIKEDF